MSKILTFLLGLVGVDVGSGFLVLVQRFAIRWVLVLAAVGAFLFAYNAAYVGLQALSATAEGYITSDLAGDPIGQDILAWAYCLMPATTSQAFSVWFSASASMALLNFYWQVLKMKSTGF